MNDDIIKLLNIVGDDLNVCSTSIVGKTKIVELEQLPTEKFCPICDFRMHSKGIRRRTVNHSILQDGFKLVLDLKIRRWKCTNPFCGELISDSYSFISPRKRMTNMLDLLILQSLRNTTYSVAEVANRFNVSDTYVFETFDRYVDMDRLPLVSAICIDEVYLKMSPYGRYALVIMDFYTGEPIDIIESRRSTITEPYFASIPFDERCRVKYLITDMYKPYLNYVDKYFPNACSVVDSFHVIMAINSKLEAFLRTLLRKYKTRDEELRLNKERESGREMPHYTSDEVYLLRKHKWVLLRNVDHIDYSRKSRYDRHFRCYMDTYSYESRFFKIHPDLADLRDLKERYIRFNEQSAGLDPEQISEQLNLLISEYQNSKYQIFREFAGTLTEHHDAIINSFMLVERSGPNGTYMSRLSNGPIESLNRKPKDLKRMARGYTNFSHLRNRVLFAARKDAPIQGIPRDRNLIHNYTGKHRGPYRKKSTDAFDEE